MTVETLVKRYPPLGPAKILSALSFAYDNEDLIEADCERERFLLNGDDYSELEQTRLLKV